MKLISSTRRWLAAALITSWLLISAHGADKPNILVILADDLGYGDVGFQGCKDIPTPNLDALAKRSVHCTSGYVTHPYCSPTRAALLTGRYQQRFGHENNPPWAPDDPAIGLPVDEVTLPQVLKTAGYATGGIGKWHLGAHPRFHPNERGFDEWFGFLHGSHTYLPNQKTAKNEGGWAPLQRNKQDVDEKEYLTDAFSREAVAFIGRHQAEPWFLYLAYNAVHMPLQAKPEVLERITGIADETRRKYAALLVSMDDGIGRVLAALHASGREQDTLIFFLSDNGGPVSVTHSSNGPLHGAKGQVFEGGMRVPFLVSWPAKLPQGKVYEEPVSSLDIFATAVALTGAKVPGSHPLEGVNIVPFLDGEKSGAPHAKLYWRTGGGEHYAVREGPWKFLNMGGSDQLFDLSADLGEEHDLAPKHPEIISRLRAAYDGWNVDNIAPLFENPNGEDRPAKKAARAKKAAQ